MWNKIILIVNIAYSNRKTSEWKLLHFQWRKPNLIRSVCRSSWNWLKICEPYCRFSLQPNQSLAPANEVYNLWRFEDCTPRLYLNEKINATIFRRSFFSLKKQDIRPHTFSQRRRPTRTIMENLMESGSGGTMVVLMSENAAFQTLHTWI
jgi:hypothetical protein